MSRLLLAPLVFALMVCPCCEQLSSWLERTVHQVPRFERSACPFDVWGSAPVECGFVVVPEDHNDPHGPTIRLATAIVKDQSPNHQSDPRMGGDSARPSGRARPRQVSTRGVRFHHGLS
jgi:hypothetical protein